MSRTANRSPVSSKKKDGRESTAAASSHQANALQINYDEVKAAFEFLDSSGRGVLKPKDLKLKLSPFYPNLSSKDYKFLVPDGEITVDKLMALLENNDLGAFDPVRDAFRVYDPNDTGYLDENALRGVLERLGYGEITKEDMEVLIRTADCDGDGRVSLEDFRHMLHENQQREKAAREKAEIERLAAEEAKRSAEGNDAQA
jgi:Ca2+-binding EF-hand superfamily protein